MWSGSSFARVLFFLYCIEAGVLMVLVPWSPSWDRAVTQIPDFSAQALLFHGALRGAVTGFGLVHLVFGVHDLDEWLARRKWGGRSVSP
jgi:hypothetical protein